MTRIADLCDGRRTPSTPHTSPHEMTRQTPVGSRLVSHNSRPVASHAVPTVHTPPRAGAATAHRRPGAARAPRATGVWPAWAVWRLPARLGRPQARVERRGGALPLACPGTRCHATRGASNIYRASICAPVGPPRRDTLTLSSRARQRSARDSRGDETRELGAVGDRPRERRSNSPEERKGRTRGRRGS